MCVGEGGVLSFRQMATKSIFQSMNIRKMVVNATISKFTRMYNKQSPITLEFTHMYACTKLGLYELFFN